MKNNKERKDVLVLSATLFSMFFGAGNLIFPASVGFHAGSAWKAAIVGFLLTGTGLPLLGVIASAKSDGDINKLGEKVSGIFSSFLGLVIILSIGPLMAIPRTGATTFEMAIKPLFPNFSPLIFALIYFGLAYLLVLNPSGIVDKIGKFLTPALIGLLSLIIILGIVKPMGPLVDVGAVDQFSTGFEIGYQTMDAFAALLFGGVIIMAVRDRGYESRETQISMTLKAGIIAIAGLTLIYGGLGYLGARASQSLPGTISKVALIRALAENSLKSFGSLGLSLVVALACLTTTIGLIATVGQYFNKLSKGKLSYRFVISLTTVVGAVLSVVGVENIVKFSGPALSFMYPLVIVLIFLTIILGDRAKKSVYQVSMALTSLLSLAQLLVDLKLLSPNLIAWIPFASLKLAWVIPAILGTFIGGLLSYE